MLLVQEKTTDHVKFGERVDQPLRINLKRKHWDPAAAEQTANDRCKRVFLKQLQDATHGLQHSTKQPQAPKVCGSCSESMNRHTGFA